MLIDGKRRNFHNRKYCLECSPFGSKNTRKLEFISEQKPQHRTWIIKVCPVCKREHNFRSKLCCSCKSNYRRFVLKQKMVEYKGGKCIRCGYNKNLKVLQFHHRNPEEKRFAIGGSHCRRWSVLKEELDKCDLLCSNCHIEVEDELVLANENSIKNYWIENGMNGIPIQNKREINLCVDCETVIDFKAKRCVECNYKHSEQIAWSSKEELERLVWEMPTSEIAKQLNCSDNAIAKRCKKWNINKPPRGYWQKLHSNKV